MFSVANHELVKSAPILSGPSELREFPDWFRDQQRVAWQQFEGLPNPTRKDQAWRFSNVALLDLAPFKISAPLSEDDRKNVLKYSRGLDHCAARMIFANDQLIEHFRSCNPTTPGFACGVNDLIAGPGAKVTYVCAQDWAENVIALQMNSTTVDHDASAMSLNLHLGGKYSRFESLSRLIGEGGRSDLLAVAVAKRQQEFDARTLQDHISPHTASDLLYKNALDDRARTTFGGLIRVEPHAHFTDAYQKVRNLLLSDDAEANSMPGLEILADNVRCTHGATSGQIDEDELFYLHSRGITTKMAQRLLVTGFLNEVIERLDHPPIAEHLHRLIEEKFAA